MRRRRGPWERNAPQQTVYQNRIFQPGTQNTKGGRLCWITDGRAGSSVGTYDVDRGYTDLLSPVMDLSHLGIAEVSFYRWYAESVGNDPFEFFVSNDGGTKWTRVLADSKSTGTWARFVHEVQIPLTSRMRFRFRAQDLNPSLVEAGIDDFAVRGAARNGTLTILSSGVRGTQLRMGIASAASSTVWLIVGTKLANINVPGLSGMLRLDPATAVLLNPMPIGSSGYLGSDLLIPNVPGVLGLTIHLQLLYSAGAAAGFGNLQSVKGR